MTRETRDGRVIRASGLIKHFGSVEAVRGIDPDVGGGD